MGQADEVERHGVESLEFGADGVDGYLIGTCEQDILLVRTHRARSWAITGEGRSDAQTLLAKAPFVVARLAAESGIPVTLVSGAIDAAALPELRRHYAGCFGLPHGPATLDACVANVESLLADRAEEIARVFDAGRHVPESP